MDQVVGEGSVAEWSARQTSNAAPGIESRSDH